AGFPYGPKSEAEILSRVVALVQSAYERYRPALVVVACNTASTLVLPALRERLPVPIVGVVPAIKTAAAVSQTRTIGLLATPGMRGSLERELCAGPPDHPGRKPGTGGSGRSQCPWAGARPRGAENHPETVFHRRPAGGCHRAGMHALSAVDGGAAAGGTGAGAMGGFR